MHATGYGGGWMRSEYAVCGKCGHGGQISHKKLSGTTPLCSKGLRLSRNFPIILS